MRGRLEPQPTATAALAAMQQVQEQRFFWAADQPDAAEGVTAFFERRPPEWSVALDSIPDFGGGD